MINKDFESWLKLINWFLNELASEIALPFDGKDLILITHCHNSKTTYSYPLSDNYEINTKLPSKIHKEEIESKNSKLNKAENLDSMMLRTNYAVREVDILLQGINIMYYFPDNKSTENSVRMLNIFMVSILLNSYQFIIPLI